MSAVSALTTVVPNGDTIDLVLPYEGVHVRGVSVLVAISSVSLVAVLGLLGAIALSAYNTRGSFDQHLFVRTHVAAYFLSLLVCDVLQAIGSILNAEWLMASSVHVGTICTAQGIIKHTSDIGTAIWTLVLAFHTFFCLVLEWKLGKVVLWTVLIGGWSLIGALVIAGPASLDTANRGPFFGVSGYWCWISPTFPGARITLDYMIMFMTALLSTILYTMMYLRLRGNLRMVGGSMQFRLRKNPDTGLSGGEAAKIARKMLIYPVAYTLLILPIAAARFSDWAGHPVPFEVTTFTAAVFLCSGLVNVILFASTRRILPPDSLRIRIHKASISAPKMLETPEKLEAGAPDPYYGGENMVAIDLNDSDEKASAHSRSSSTSTTSSSGRILMNMPLSPRAEETMPVDHSMLYPQFPVPAIDPPRPGSLAPDSRRSPVDSVYNLYGQESRPTSMVGSYYQYSGRDGQREEFPEELSNRIQERRF